MVFCIIQVAIIHFYKLFHESFFEPPSCGTYFRLFRNKQGFLSCMNSKNTIAVNRPLSLMYGCIGEGIESRLFFHSLKIKFLAKRGSYIFVRFIRCITGDPTEMRELSGLAMTSSQQQLIISSLGDHTAFRWLSIITMELGPNLK